jgi:carbamate kinase
MYDDNGKLHGVEAVIDKDLASSLLARELEADFFIMATDAEAVYQNYGTPVARAIKRAHPEEMKKFDFPAGSMGPKVEAACEFAELTGKTAGIGALADLEKMIRGEAGTIVSTSREGIEYWPPRG